MKKPNLFIAGAQKSGSSSLYRMLKVHRDIFLSENKELNFFNQPDFEKAKLSDYLGNFEKAGTETYIGEATPHYFDSNAEGVSRCARRIREALGPDARTVLILRNPVERTIAGWRHNFVYGKITKDMSPFDVPEGHGVIRLSKYKQHYKAWTSHFPEENVHMCLFDDLVSTPRNLLVRLLEWLNLDYDAAAYDAYPFKKAFNDLSSTMEQKGVSEAPVATRDIVEALLQEFEPDIEFVRGLMGRKLPEWTNVRAICSKF